MAPKANGKEKAGLEEEDVLQAVILADSFNKRFSPLTLNKPRVRSLLLPRCTVLSTHVLSASRRSSVFYLYATPRCSTGH